MEGDLKEYDEDKEYEVEDIIGEEDYNGVTYFKVRWKDFGEEKDTYEPIENLFGCQEILNRYFERRDKERLKKKEPNKKKSKTTSKVVKPKEKKSKSKENKKAKSSLDDTFSSDYDFSSSNESFTPPNKKAKSTTDKKKSSSDKSKTKEKKKKKSKEIKIFINSDNDSDSGDIFNDLPQNEPKSIIKTPSFSTNMNASTIILNKPKAISEEQNKKKKEKPAKKTVEKKKNDVSPKSKKSEDKKKKKNDASTEKSKSKKTHSIKDDDSAKPILPFDIFLDDSKPENEFNNIKDKQNFAARYSEEHRLVLDPFPIKEIKNVIDDNGIESAECELPDKLATEFIPVSILRILHPNLLQSSQS